MTKPKKWLAAALVVAAAGAACTESAMPPTTATSTTVATTQPPVVETTTTTPPPPSMEELLARDDLVIFNAFPPKPEDITYALPPGQLDFHQLWTADAPWQEALANVDVYRLHAFQVRHYLSDDQLLTLFDFLEEHQIPLMLETEPLRVPDPEECDHTESYEAGPDLEMAQRIKELGGQVDAIAIEEPFHFAYKLDTPGACQYSIERIVDEVMDHVDNLRSLFGPIPVGTIEPIWQSPRTTPDDLAFWLDSFAELSGEEFAFLHVDPDWYRPDWADVAVGIEAVADERGVPFGILYNGGIEPDNVAWMQFMMENVATFEIEHGATPQHVSFQSWVNWPDHALPETDPGALTSSIVRYFGQRVRLSAEQVEDGVAATLVDGDGNGVAGIPLTATALTSGYSRRTETITGIVPDGVDTALVAMRGNVEDAGVGVVDAQVFEVIYREGGSDENKVPNPTFTSGLTSWGAYGDNPGRVTTSNSGESRMILEASPDQDIWVDGDQFAVVAGQEFEYTVTYSVAQEAGGNSLTTLIFLGGSERMNVRHLPTPVDLGVFTTDENGEVLLPRDVFDEGATQLSLSFDGDLDIWPASLTMNVSW